MTKLITAFGLLSLFTAVAVADDDTPAPAASEDKPAPVDCATLEGDEKASCEAEQAKPAAEKKSKGKGLQKSDNNRMENIEDE